MKATVLPNEQYFKVVTGLLARDEQSLAELYDFTLAKVYGLALKITRRHDLAEEVVEDTYLQAWQQVTKFDSARGPFIAWLMVICRSRAIDVLRRMDYAESFAEPQNLMQSTDSDGLNSANSPLDILLMLERESAIRRALASLNAMQRQLISLAFFKGYTHEEIAQHTQMPLGTVKSTIKRAQNKLKMQLQHIAINPDIATFLKCS